MTVRSNYAGVAARALALLTLAALAAGGARARWIPVIDLEPVPGGVLLSIDRRPALRFEESAAPWAVVGRPQWVAARLRKLLEKGFIAANISVDDTPHGSIIVTGGGPLLTVTDSEARSKGMTRQSLALTWARTLRELLTVPPLVVQPDRLLVPFGETRVLYLAGAAADAARVSVTPENRLIVHWAPGDRKISIEGGDPGDATVSVSAGDQTVSVPVEVRKYAGTMAGAHLTLTGSGPDRAGLRKLIADTVERALVLEPGATARLDADSIPLPREIPSAGLQVGVPVEISGSDYLPVRGSAPVRISWESVGRTEPNFLFYSNRPEMLRRYGTLFTGLIRPNHAVRLLYHHQSAMREPIRFLVQLRNGPTNSRIQIIDGSAQPQIDTFQIGDRAAARFFPAWLNDSGYVQDLGPGETFTLLDQRLAHDDTTSGLFHFVLLSGSAVTVQIRAAPPDVWSGVTDVAPNPEVYSVTRRRIAVDYRVGDRWSFVPLGRDPVTAADSSHPLRGNYGVVYDLSVQLDNPTGQKNTADVVFDPAAGASRGVFVVDGKMVETNLLQPPQEFTLYSCPLDPGETRKVHILTMPLAGSNYPARFIIRPRYAVARGR